CRFHGSSPNRRQRKYFANGSRDQQGRSRRMGRPFVISRWHLDFSRVINIDRLLANLARTGVEEHDNEPVGAGVLNAADQHAFTAGVADMRTRVIICSVLLVLGSACRAPQVERYTRGLGERMTLQQMLHAKLWLAGEAGNWDLAAYEIKELGE